MNRGRVLITVFGIDGSGKTTQCKILQEQLLKRGYKAIHVWSRREPFILKPLIRFVKKAVLREKKNIEGQDFKEIARGRRGLFSNPMVRHVWFLLSLLEYRLLLSRRVFSSHKDADILICDRYLPDAIVDLAINYNYNPDQMNRLLDHPFLPPFPKPTISIFVDIPSETGAARKMDGTSVAYLEERVSLYQAVAKKTGAVFVDGNESVGKIADQIQNVVFSKIRN